MKKQKLTLIEVVIVVVLTVLLALFAAFFLQSARESARKISCTGNLKCIGLSLRMYSNVYTYGEQPNEVCPFPEKNGRSGLQMLAINGFLENTQVYTCPSSEDVISDTSFIHSNSSYSYAGGLTEADSVDSAMMSDRRNNHKQYGNILFLDGHVKGYTGINWSSNRGGSVLTDF